MKAKGDRTVDCIIVGAGPAGLAAALEAARRGISAVVFEAAEPGGQALAAGRVDNFPGFPEGVSGRKLMRRWVDHVRAKGVSIIPERVEKIARRGSLFVARTRSGEHRARSAIVATGLVPKTLGVPGERELIGRKVFSYVDPATLMHEDKRVMVVGGGDVAFDMALGFAAAARSVTIVMRGSAPKCTASLLERARAAGVGIITGFEVLGFTEHNYGVGVSVSNGIHRSNLEADLIVACIGKDPHADFLSPALAKGRPGLFTAGDFRHGVQRHISIAAGEGTLAASAAAEYLKSAGGDA